MGMKIICECGSSFPLEKVKGLKACPICGASFDDFNNGEDSANEDAEKIDLEHPDMYFYSIDSEDKYEDQNRRKVYCQCTSCRKVNVIPYIKFDVIKSEYLQLKKDLDLKCKGCGKEVTNLTIPERPEGWRELNMWEKDYEHQPKCPICSSTKIHKISMTNKAASIVTFGILATGHVSKTYKCDVCGSKF